MADIVLLIFMRVLAKASHSPRLYLVRVLHCRRLFPGNPLGDYPPYEKNYFQFDSGNKKHYASLEMSCLQLKLDVVDAILRDFVVT